MAEVKVLNKGNFDTVDEKDVQYEFENPDQFFGMTQTLIPMLNSVSAARNFYGHKFINQSLPLVHGEAPLVQNLKDAATNTSFQDDIGRNIGNVYADDDAEITKVTPDLIEYKDSKGKVHQKELYNHEPFNRKTYLHNIPLVKKGDKVKANTLLAHTNYTDKNGTLNIGVNARVGLVPYKGWSLDDAVVISSDFAKKLTSQHSYKYTEDDNRDIKTGRDHYMSLFPKEFTKEQLENIDDNGVVKVGTKVTQGSPLILSTKPRMISSADSDLGKLSKYLRGSRTDAAVRWDHEDDGVVTDVLKTRNGYKVIVESESPAKEGDKLIERAGNKGTLSKIIPMDQMPRTKDGKPLDILINPLSIPSRQNGALMFEMLLGKVAEKTGKPIKVPSFDRKSTGKWYDFIQKKLDEAGLTDTEEVYDPVEDRFLESPITVGNVYVQKLHHQGESKLSARGQGIYNNNQQAAKGGEEGMMAKKIGTLESAGLMSAGAYDVIKDIHTVRGQQNDEYWRSVREGRMPQLTKKAPFVWDKMLALMRGAGFTTNDKGNGKLRLAPFSDKGLEALNPVELTNGEIISLKDLKPVAGGLFDPAMSLTNKWGKITLAEPIINPPFENQVATLLGVKKQDLYDIIQGKKDLEQYGSGSNAIKKALSSIDLRSMYNNAVKDFKEGPKTGKQKALNRMQYIKGLMKNGLRPEDLMISAVPVIPSTFRPYAMMGDTFIPGDANELYKEVFNVNQAHKELRQELGENLARENALNLYKSVKALYGVEEPDNKKLKQRGVSGFLEKLTGSTAKFSYMQNTLNSKTVDFSGRAVADPNPDLGIDEVGVPYEMAWKLWAPYIQAELTKRGMSSVDAVAEIEKQTEKAKQALERVVEDKYAYIVRAPSWHRGNMLGVKAKLHNGKNLLVNPLITTSQNLDFDGDCQYGSVIALIKK